MNFIYLLMYLTAFQLQAGNTVLPGRGSQVYFMAYPGNHLIIAADRYGARLIDPRGAPPAYIDCPANAAAFSKAKDLLALNQPGGGIQVFSVPGGELNAELLPPGEGALTLAFSGDGALLAAGGRDGRLKFWHTADWSEAGSLRPFPGPFSMAGFYGDRIVTFAPGDPLLRLWDPYGGRTALNLKSPLTRLALTDPSGSRLASATADHFINIWDRLTGAEPARSEFPEGAAAAAAFSASGALLAAAGQDGAINFISSEDGSRAGYIPGAGKRYTALAFSPSALYLAAAAADGSIELFPYPGDVWTSTGPVKVKNAGGAPLATLPAGIRLEALKSGSTHWFIADGGGLSGWALADQLSAENPDLKPPEIRLSSQTWADPVLTVKGRVKDDGRLVSVTFSGKPVNIKFSGPGLAYFEFSLPLDPDTDPVIEAADASGRKTALKLDPGLPLPLYKDDYSPPAAFARAKAAAPPPDEIPAGPADPDALAVVIGQRDYRNADIPPAEYALEDARAVREHLAKALGFENERIIYLEDPTRAELDGIFGDSHGGGTLKNLVKPGFTRLFVYYSGHGASDPAEGRAYLVPSDARPDQLSTGGLALNALYSRLADLKAASVTVVLEACFSGLTPGGALIANASPLIVARRAQAAAGLNIFASSSPQQVSSWYPAKHRGLFTYFFLKALREARPGPVKLGLLRDAVNAAVPHAAQTLYGRAQTPIFSGDPELTLGK